MGPPLVPTLANIFVGYLEYKIVPEFQCKYIRYVDGCLIIKNNVEVSSWSFENLNQVHKAIKFTKETEFNDQLSFLHVLIKERADRFMTSAYRKLSQDST